jgi:hypothetical protein
LIVEGGSDMPRHEEKDGLVMETDSDEIFEIKPNECADGFQERSLPRPRTLDSIILTRKGVSQLPHLTVPFY